MSKFTKYILFTFITSWAIEMIGIHDLDLNNAAGMLSFSQAMSLCMFMPTLGALFARADIRKMGWRLNIDRDLKLVLFAWFMPTVFELAGAMLYFIVFSSDYDPAVGFERILDPNELAEFEKNGSHYAGYIAKEIFYSLTSFYTFLGIIMGLGEEIGWRGYMYPELKKGLGRTKAVLVGGVIHGAWHFPLMLFAGYEYGKEYYGAPLLGLFAFCIFTTATGMISFFLYERSHSIWLPAIIHGTTNAAFNVNLLRGNDHAERTIFGPPDIGLISVIPMVIFAGYILYTENKRDSLDNGEEY